jgi:TP53 regulating kinase-like protein
VPTTTATDTDEPFLPAPFNTTSPSPTLITQGAEALLYRTHFLDTSTPAALKARPSKPYRHPTLDARLTKQRVLAEARVLVKLSALRNDPGASNEVNVPAVLSLEWDVARKVKGAAEVKRERGGGGSGGAWLLMEWIDGESVKDLLRRLDVWCKARAGGKNEPGGGKAEGEDYQEVIKSREEDVKALLRRIGRAVGALHSRGGVIHGDLTTSNIMIRPPPPSPTTTSESNAGTTKQEDLSNSTSPPSFAGEIVLIDFGLATQSLQDEDRAVDLYVLERAFGSTHPRQEDWFDAEVLQSPDGYRGSFKGAGVVLKRLEDVRLRGRKRSMVG